MNSAFDNLKLAAEHAKAGWAEFDKAAKILSCGPSSFYFEKLEEYVTALFTRFAPFHVGDRVKLVFVPKVLAWSHCSHFLVAGGRATVAHMDYSNGHFVCDCVFDKESWCDQDGTLHPTPENERHTFRLSDDMLELE